MTGNSGYFVLGAAEIAFLKWFRLFFLIEDSIGIIEYEVFVQLHVR